MHQPFGSDDLAAKNLADRLMAEANTKDRHLTGEMFNDRFADAGVFGLARPGGDDDLFWPKFFDLFESDLVVAENLGLCPDLAEILDEIVGE